MSLSDAKRKFSELQEEIVKDSYWVHEKEVDNMQKLLKEHPDLCSDALKMIKKNSDGINISDKINLLSNIMAIKPELNIYIIKNIEHFCDDYFKDSFLKAIVTSHPELFPQVKKVADDKTSIVKAFIDAKDKLSEKDVNLIMGEFSLKNFRKLYSEDLAEGLEVIEKFSKGNPENTEIQRKCLLVLQIYNLDKQARSITDEILTLQPNLKKFANQINILRNVSLKKNEDDTDSLFEYTTESYDFKQLWNQVVVKRDKKNTFTSYIERKKKEQESYIKQREKERELSNSPEMNNLLNEINFKDDTSSVLADNIATIIEQTKNTDILKVLASKKEEAYGVWDYEHIRELEECFAKKNYIEKTLNKKYPGLSLEEKLIQAAYDVVNSGDEQKKKEFNDFILAEGEPRLAELDAKVMDYLHENCTQSNLDKVNALRSFYGLKVELKAGNTVDIDERTAIRKVFDRTWSSYERGKNTDTGEPYYSETEMDAARKENPKQVTNNPYYENAVSPAYRKYFEEHNIYEIYHAPKSDEEKQYSTQEYFDSLIDKPPFKALRRHGLYNDMKIICETLERLQVEPEISSQFNLKDLSDMVVNSHNTLEDRKVYNRDTEEYMFTKSPHTDELYGNWRDPYYWHQYDDDDEYDDEYDNDDYKDVDENDETSVDEKQYDEEGFEIIQETDNYSEANEEVAARDAWWEDLADHNPKAVKYISESFARHGREDHAISGFWEAASYGTPGVGSRRDWRLLSATLHHAQAIQYGGNDDKKNFVGATRYYDSYGDTFNEDDMHVDYHKSFHRRDTPMDELYINSGAKSSDDRLATEDKTDENSQKAFLETSFTDPHMHFYAGFRKIDQYTDPLYHMRNIEKENQERVDKTEKSLEYLTRLGNALSSISICISEAMKTEEKIITATGKITKAVENSSNIKDVTVTKGHSHKILNQQKSNMNRISR